MIVLLVLALLAVFIWACCKAADSSSWPESHCKRCGCKLQCDENCPRRK